MRQNTVFSTKNTKNLSPLPKPLHREGTPPPTPHLPRYLRRLDLLHAEILGTPLYADIVLVESQNCQTSLQNFSKL